jgi:hypothetical protein
MPNIMKTQYNKPMIQAFFFISDTQNNNTVWLISVVYQR